MSEEIACCLTEVENCFKLLVPLYLGPNPSASSEDASYTPGPGWATPGRSGGSDPQDEEQPCCSRDLPASACHLGAAGGREGLPQIAPEDPSEDEEEGSDLEEFVRSHGLGSHKYTLAIELSSGKGSPVLPNSPAPPSWGLEPRPVGGTSGFLPRHSLLLQPVQVKP